MLQDKNGKKIGNILITKMYIDNNMSIKHIAEILDLDEKELYSYIKNTLKLSKTAYIPETYITMYDIDFPRLNSMLNNGVKLNKALEVMNIPKIEYAKFKAIMELGNIVTYDDLYYKYINESKTLKEISAEYNIPAAKISVLLNAYNISRLDKIQLDEETFIELYIDNNLPLNKIADMYNLEMEEIWSFKNRLNIPNTPTTFVSQLVSPDILYRDYILYGMTQLEIADKYSCSTILIRKMLTKNGILKYNMWKRGKTKSFY